MSDFGKIILSKPDEPDQEFILNKSLVTLGRATTNDIVLATSRVSRNHAQVQCTDGAIILTDLNSANGVRVNGQRITETKIQPGDTIDISGCVLQYLAPAPEIQEEVTMINSEKELELTLEQMTVPMSLNDTSLPRLIIHAPDRTREVLLFDDSYTIGRTAGSKLVLDYPKISRNHA